VFYRLLTYLLYPVARIVQAFSGGSTYFPERMGKYPETVPALGEGRFRVWLHGASAGEVNALQPLVKALRESYPSLYLIITTTSLTGRKMAIDKKLADRVCLAPLDLSIPVRRSFDSIDPNLLLIAETEIWPIWLSEAKKRKVPVVLVNGRVSDKSYPLYRFVGSFFKNAIMSFSECLVQTRVDQERLTSLGALKDRVAVVGQMKYDLCAPDAGRVEAFAGTLELAPSDPVFTFGSLREGEDQEVLAALPRLLQAVPQAKVVLAPRHFRNLGLFEHALRVSGVQWTFRSVQKHGPWRVLVLDTMGELSLAYAVSRAAFVGGTLVPVGGHNVMEPVLSGVPVCFGPYQANVREAAAALIASGGAAQVATAEEGVDWMARFADAELSKVEGAKALAAVEPLRGATRKTLERLKPFLPS
jgi:3-deoxy-D-manno-octulosonic-acid transferase